MLIDASELRRDLETAVCVIGAGPAGIALATHFNRRGIDAVVLVGGGEDPESAHQQLARVVPAGIPTDDTMRGNIRALGGSSQVWGGYCLRLAPEDFEERPWIPNSGWPIGLADLEDGYAKAAAFIAGDEARDGPWSFAPEDHARRDVLRSPLLRHAVTYIRPVRFGRRHRDELHAGRARVCLHAHAVELEADAASRHVSSVLCRTLSGNGFRVRARHVVLAAGGIQNARLLLASRIGNAHDAVGRYFMQHAEHRHATLLTPDFPALLRLEPGAKAPGITLPTAFTSEHQRRHSLPSCHFLLQRADYYSRDDESAWMRLRRQLSRWRRMYGRGAAERAMPRWVSWLSRGDASMGETSVVPFLVRPEQVPNPDSRVSLAEERDALGTPIARVDWRLTDKDWHYADQCATWFGCALGAEGIGRVRFARGAAREAAKTYLHGGFHYYGTTRMSDDPRRGVVDRDCKVHGVDNLHVAGSSVFPTSGYANPTFTILALALRLGEHLEARVRAAR